MNESEIYLERQANLSPAKKALLAKLKGGKLQSRAIPRHQYLDSVPLSFAQERLWFLDQLAPNQPVYNEPIALRLRGNLRLELLQKSFNEIVNRHGVLRTAFTTVEGQPVQVIAKSLNLNLPVLNLQDLTLQEQEKQVQRLAIEEASQPFDLSQRPLIRVKLLQLRENEYILLLTMHHIICDRWSFAILLQELTTLYQSYCNNQPSTLKELPIQYADYTIWEKQYLTGEVLEKQLSYWKKQLADAPALLELPTDYPRPPVLSNRGSQLSFSLSPELTQVFKTFSQQEEATLFITLLTAFKVLLYRYTQQTDILVGTTIAGRNREELESLIGFFVNTLVLRTDLSEQPSFRQLLRRVRQVALEAYAHQDLPFEKIVEKLQVERNLSHTPLFQVMFQLQNTPNQKLELASLTWETLEIHNQTTKFDLVLSMIETEQGLIGNFYYNTDLFATATIARMQGHFQTLLESIAANPDQEIGKLPLLTSGEQQQFLEWNHTHFDYSQDQCIHQLFAEQVETTPEAIALVFEDTALTYQQLDQKANQLAHYLQKLGVGTEVLVGICVERSLEMVIGILGILKAGAAYVPIDPEYPSERLAYMLEDSQVQVLLTQEKLLTQISHHHIKTVCLDSDWQEIAQEATSNLTCSVQGENLAYVIYTSGSTGKPKGAMNTHQGIYNRLLWMQTAYKLNAADRVLQKTPFSFDVSVWEFFWPLLNGASLVMAKPGGHGDRSYLIDLICKEQITTLHFVPSMLQVFLDGEDVQKCTSIKRVICSGEALPLNLQTRFFQRFNCELHNLYGPTEAAIDVTFWQCQKHNPWPTVPIGQPISNIQIYILDSHLQPVPVGIPGELYIGGAGLARGYWHRPELTAEKFIPHPFINHPNQRLYKTGDLGRYLPDGNIEYLGRIDHQVKIRGFRIELEEIEAQLSAYSQIRETVVIVREDEPGEKSLVAYVSPDGDVNIQISELRSFLQSKLPAYMIPTNFVILPTLPLTPNGKINRKALPKPEKLRLKSTVAYVMPQTEIETKIVKIWQEVLKIEQIGIEDNFFELGGHSLLMVRVQQQLQEVLKISVPILELFRYPTISSLADYFSQLQKPTLSIQTTDHQGEKITTAKEQQKKRLQKMKSLRNI